MSQTLLSVLGLGLAWTAAVAGQSAPEHSAATAQQAAADTQPTIEAALLGELMALDARLASVGDLRARFEQEKHTPLLKGPIRSAGQVLVKGQRTHWTTGGSSTSKMATDGRELRIYYPDERAMEIYPLEGRMAELAASPLPRLAILREAFAIERCGADAPLDLVGPDYLHIRLTPLEPSLREQVRWIHVAIDRRTGLAALVEMVEAEEERTVLRFHDPRVNAGVEDGEVQLVPPVGTAVRRPLENFTGSQTAPSRASP